MDKKKKNGKLFSALSKVFCYMKNYKNIMAAALVMAAVGAVLTLVGPNKIGEMTDLMKEGLAGTMDMEGIAHIGFVMIAIYGTSALFTFAQHYIMATVTLKTSKRMRQDLSDKINQVPLSYFNKCPQGEILSKITNDVQTLQQGLANSLPEIISAAAQFVGCIIMMFVTQWRLASCVIGVTFAGLLVLGLIMKNSQKYFLARQESIGRLNGFVEEMYSGHQVVRLSRAEGKIKKKFEGLNRAVYDANWKSMFLSGQMQPLMNVIGNVGYVVVCVVGAALALDGTITFGVIISFVLYCRLFTSPLTQIAEEMTNLQMAAASAHRIFDFLETEELPDEKDKKDAIWKVRGEISFRHVCFSYPDSPERVIIKDFSAEVQPGQKVAIVGPTGAGKTTMVNLLMRFFEVNGGFITVDGIPLCNLTRENIHNLFSMVLQDTWLFEGTVRENLVYNMKDITDADLERVLESCGLSHFVHSLPDGLDTVLSENTSISAGQKQLFTIARAMLQDSPMLILDEATSSVDTRTEAVIQKAMDELMAGRTSFVIAHRLSTIKNADLILVMKDGDVIESGNHRTLMEKKGFYASLYNSQFEAAV